MKKQNYEVIVTYSATVVVMGATNNSQAMDWANDKCRPSFTPLAFDQAEIARIIPDENLEAARRHADAISEYED